MAKVFKWQVTSESTAKHTFNVRAVKFGDGYEQRQKLTLKPKMQTWQIRLAGKKPLIEEIKGFLIPAAVLSRFTGLRRGVSGCW